MNTAPLSAAPSWFVDLARKDRPQPKLVTPEDEGCAAATVYQRGQRNDGLYREACKLRRMGFSDDLLFKLASAINRECCEPPLGDPEVGAIVTSAHRHAPDARASAAPAPLVGVTLLDALEMDFPERDLLLDPLLASGEIALLIGPRGSGKTWIACGVALAVSGGVEVFGRWSGKEPRCVAYIDGEQGLQSLQERLKSMAYALGVVDDERLRKMSLLADDQVPDGLPSLLDEDGQARIDDYLDRIGAELVIVDNLSALAGARDENDAGAVDPIVQWIKRQKRRGRAALIVHHTGKDTSRGARGTSRLEDPVELILSVSRAPGAKPSDGAVFRVTNTKARHVFGAALEPFEAAIRLDEERVCAHLDVREGNDLRDARIVELAEEDMKQREIAKEIGCSASTVNGVLKRHRKRRG